MVAYSLDDNPEPPQSLKDETAHIFDNNGKQNGYMDGHINKPRTLKDNKPNGHIYNGYKLDRNGFHNKLMNGITPNVKIVNGNLPNGDIPNGHIPNGHTSNGHIENGHIPNGDITNDHTPDDVLKNVHDQNGHMGNEDMPNGHIINGHTPNGHLPNGNTHNGYIPDSNTCNENIPNVHNANGHLPNGNTPNGHIPNNTSPNPHMINSNSPNDKINNKIVPEKIPAIFANGHPIIVDDDIEKCLTEDSCRHSKSDYMSSADFGEKSINCCENKVLMVKTIVAGQILSLMLCGSGTAATALNVNYRVRTPCFNAFLMYTILALTFGIYVLITKDVKKLMKKHWWKYLIVAVLDVEANYLLTKSYSYTTLTSVQLCDSFTIPTVMVISFIFLRIRYKIIHYTGVVVCIGGAVSLVFLDGGDGKDNAPNEMAGDIMALSAAILYGTSQVGQEYLVKKYSSTTYLGVIGIFGFLISGIQTAIVERQEIDAIDWKWQIGLIVAAFVLCQYFYYTVMPLVMSLSSATVVNLSLLTSDLYTLTVGLALFQYQFSYWYFFVFGAILTGLILYNIKPTPTAPKKEKKKKKMKKAEKKPVTESHFVGLDHFKFNGHTPLLTSNNNNRKYSRF